jgi:hypothetical protein
VPLEDVWQVDRALKASQSGSHFVTKTVWLAKADLDAEEVQGRAAAGSTQSAHGC